ncbi:MAG: potassium transporter TrkG, partial [Planctomycetota bacterium]
THKPTGTQFTFFGQAVILLLIQTGALSILFAGAVLARLAGRALAPARADEALARPVGPTVRFVLTATLACEAIGAIAMYSMFAAARPDGSALTGLQAAWYSLFHAVSAFCNAGFSLCPRGLMQGLNEGWPQPLRGAWQVYGVIAPLIVLGGLGMSVLGELVRVPARIFGGGPRPSLSGHARVVLTATAILIVAGAGVLLAVESSPRGHSPEKLTRWVDESDRPAAGERLVPGERKLYALPPGQRAVQSLFESISARSAGFSTVDVGSLTPGGTLWLCGLMSVGGAPGGAAGGMKVTVLAVLVLAAWGALRGRLTRGNHPRVSLHLLARAVTVALAYTGLVGGVTILLCLATGWDSRFFLKLLVEACSACGNVGFSLEVSERLGRGMELAKGALIAGMFLGKAGFAALALSLAPGGTGGPDAADADLIV